MPFGDGSNLQLETLQAQNLQSAQAERDALAKQRAAREAAIGGRKRGRRGLRFSPETSTPDKLGGTSTAGAAAVPVDTGSFQ